MTDQPTREQLLHLVDRARRGVALPAEHDQLAAGVSAMADALAEQRTTTVEALDASHVTLRRYRKRAEQAEAANTTHRALLEEARDALEAAGINEAHGGNSWPRLVPAVEELAQRAEQAKADLDRAQQAACRTAESLRKAERAVDLLAGSHRRAEQAEAALRDASPILQRALDCLDATCRYHGDRLDPDEYGRRVRSEACCDTGVEPRRAREAKAALARIGSALDEQPSTTA